MVRVVKGILIYLFVGIAGGGLADGYHLQKCLHDATVEYSLSSYVTVALFWPSAVFTLITAPIGLDYSPCENSP